jgi:hypothetical protein
MFHMILSPAESHSALMLTASLTSKHDECSSQRRRFFRRTGTLPLIGSLAAELDLRIRGVRRTKSNVLRDADFILSPALQCSCQHR